MARRRRESMLRTIARETERMAEQEEAKQKLWPKRQGLSEATRCTPQGGSLWIVHLYTHAQCFAPNCVSVTPALMTPVDEVPPEMMFPASSTISEPLHFWCVSVSTLFSRSF